MATNSVNLQNILSTLFGVSAGDSSDILKFGVVVIDGHKWDTVENGTDVPLEKIKGKEVEITASPRSFKFAFTGEQMLDERYPVQEEDFSDTENPEVKKKIKEQAKEIKKPKEEKDYSQGDDERRTSPSE